MKTEIRYKLVFLHPGAFFAESSSKKVDSTFLPREIPGDCYGFYFTKTEVAIDPDTKKEYFGETKQVGNTYLIGKKIPLAKIPATHNGRDTEILKKNIEYNSPTKTAVLTRMNNWQADDKNVTVLSENQFAIGKNAIYTG